MSDTDTAINITKMLADGAAARVEIGEALEGAGVPHAAGRKLTEYPALIKRFAGTLSNFPVVGVFFPENSTIGKRILRRYDAETGGVSEEVSGYFDSAGTWCDETGITASIAKYNTSTGEFTETASENTFDKLGIAPWAKMTKVNAAVTIDDVSYDNWFVGCPKFYFQRKWGVTMTWNVYDTDGALTGTTEEVGELILISTTKIEGFELHPLFLDNDGATELPYHFYSCYHGTTSGSKLFSQSTGANASHTITRNTFKNYARALNAGTLNDATLGGLVPDGVTLNDCSFNGYTITEHSAITLLFYVEYCNRNTQAALPDNNSGGVYSNCGVCDPIVSRERKNALTDTLGSGYAVDGDGKNLGNVYRGIENLSGSKWIFVHDFVLKLDSTTNTYSAWVCSDRSKFVNDGTLTVDTLPEAGYRQIATTLIASRSNYYKTSSRDEANPGILIPNNEVLASASTGTCDYIYIGTQSEPTILVGGIASLGAASGLSAVAASGALALAAVYVAARPSLSLQHPQA